MFRYLPLIFKNSMRNKRRSFLTIASASLSLCLLGTLTAIYHAFFMSEAPPDQALRLITRNRVSPAIKLPISYRDKIRRIPGVREVGAFQYFGGTYKDPRNVFARYAVEPDRIFTIRTDCEIPESIKQRFRKEKTSCLLGRTLANRYGLVTGDRVSLKGDIFPVNVDLIVAGVYDNPTDNDSLWFRLDYLFDLLPERYRHEVFAFQILADGPESVGRISKEVDELFRNSTAPTKTEAERAFELTFVSMLGNVKAFLVSISLALMFTLLLVTANTMAMSVRERVREVGVLKTLGFTTEAILGLLLGESAFLTLVGGVIGCCFAWALVVLVSKAPAIIVPVAGLGLDPGVAALLVLVGVLVGLVSALAPAWRAARTPILIALRSID